jgi:hypothetical protein
MTRRMGARVSVECRVDKVERNRLGGVTPRTSPRFPFWLGDFGRRRVACGSIIRVWTRSAYGKGTLE